MAAEPDLQMLTDSGVAHHCARETDAFFQRHAHDPRYCFELFRRAIVGGNEQAWKLLYAQYRPLVTSWVQRHPALPSCGEEMESVVNCAFERMWGALTPAKFNQFSDLKSVLRYLQMCVHSVILDGVRKSKPPAVSFEDMGPAEGQMILQQHSQDRPQDRLYREEFWQAMESRMNSEQERMVLVGSFVLGLKPREIAMEYQDTFQDVQDVYRVKENVLARLRRDLELRKILVGDA